MYQMEVICFSAHNNSGVIAFFHVGYVVTDQMSDVQVCLLSQWS